jgi:hypothetical protein
MHIIQNFLGALTGKAQGPVMTRRCGVGSQGDSGKKLAITK